MPDVIQCPHCRTEVSARAIQCDRCGASISEVPDSITVELLTSLRDEDLLMFCFSYAVEFLKDHACDVVDGPSDASVLAKLPRGIRSGYTLVVLVSEIGNGGFYQWFTNSSGRLTYETLDDLRMVGAMEHIRIVEKAIKLNGLIENKYPAYKDRWEVPPNACGHSELEVEFWPDINTNFMPEFDQLSNEIYELEGVLEVEGTNPSWISFARFARKHAKEFLTEPR